MVRNYEPKHHRDWRRTRVAQLHGEGWSARQIARRLGVSDSTVRADLRDAPVAAPRAARLQNRRGWHAEAEMLRGSGHPEHQRSQPMPFWMIAERLGITEETVRRYFARQRSAAARAAEAARLKSAGHANREIAEHLGVSETTVRRDLERAQVRRLGARKVPPDALSGAKIAHPDGAAANVTPLRRIS